MHVAPAGYISTILSRASKLCSAGPGPVQASYLYYTVLCSGAGVEEIA